MFEKTKAKLEEKYVKPAEQGIAVAIILSMLAIVISAVAIAMTMPLPDGVSRNAV